MYESILNIIAVKYNIKKREHIKIKNGNCEMNILFDILVVYVYVTL